jgi:hypothetical protein
MLLSCFIKSIHQGRFWDPDVICDCASYDGGAPVSRVMNKIKSSHRRKRRTNGEIHPEQSRTEQEKGQVLGKIMDHGLGIKVTVADIAANMEYSRAGTNTKK